MKWMIGASLLFGYILGIGNSEHRRESFDFWPKRNTLPVAMSSETLADWRSTSDILFDDVFHAAGQVDKASEPWMKRGYVRAVFAAIEGTTFGLKRLAINIWQRDQPKLDADELELLLETEFDEHAKAHKRFPRFGDNIKVTFRVFAKAHGFKSQADHNAPGWADLLESAEMRNRLMHPKCGTDLNVSEDDLKKLKAGADWFFRNRNELMGMATSELKSRV